MDGLLGTAFDDLTVRLDTTRQSSITTSSGSGGILLFYAFPFPLSTGSRKKRVS